MTFNDTKVTGSTLTPQEWDDVIDYIASGKNAGITTFTVWNDGVYSYVRDGNSGSILYKNASDSTAIQWALNKMVNGGLLFIKAGVYYLDAGLTVAYNHTNIEGEGNSTYLIVNNNVNPTAILKASGSDIIWNVNLSNFTLDGNKSNNSSGHGLDFSYLNGHFTMIRALYCKEDGFHTDNQGNYLISCNAAENDGAGFGIHNSYGSLIFDAYTRLNNYGYHISGSTAAGDTMLIKCEVDEDINSGILIDGNVERVTISDCYIFNTIGNGIEINSSTVNIFGSSIISNDHGILIKASENITIQGCFICSNRLHGIFLTGSYSQYNSICGNIINNNNTTGSTYSGIRLDNVNYTTIANNIINSYDSPHQYGIDEDASCYHVKYVYNHIANASTANCRFNGWYAFPYREIQGNSGWISENHGTFTLTTTSGSVSHGLASIAKIIYLTATGSSTVLPYQGSLSWTYSGSTGFWIHQTGSGKIGGTWVAKIE